MEELLAKIPDLEALIGQLQAENRQLRAEIEELRARLAQSSTNSSRPPAADGLQKKTIKPALIKQAGKNQADSPDSPASPVKPFFSPSNPI